MALDKQQDAWPPDEGWHFQDKRAAYKMHVFLIKGRKMQMLQMLADETDEYGYITHDKLYRRIWKDAEPQNVSQTKNKLNRLLNCTFTLPQGEEAIVSYREYSKEYGGITIWYYRLHDFFQTFEEDCLHDDR
jgi:hypothetical protein